MSCKVTGQPLLFDISGNKGNVTVRRYRTGFMYVRCLPKAVTADSQSTGKRLQAVRGIVLYFLLPVMVFRQGSQETTVANRVIDQREIMNIH